MQTFKLSSLKVKIKPKVQLSLLLLKTLLGIFKNAWGPGKDRNTVWFRYKEMSKCPQSKMMQSLLENSVKCNCVSHKLQPRPLAVLLPGFHSFTSQHFLSQMREITSASWILPLTQTCELTPESVTMNLARYGSRIEPGKKDCRDVLVNHTCMHLFLQKWIRGSVPEGHIQPWAEHPSLEKAPCRRATENLVSEEGQQRKTFGHQRSRGSWPHARTPPAPGRAQDGWGKLRTRGLKKINLSPI